MKTQTKTKARRPLRLTPLQWQAAYAFRDARKEWTADMGNTAKEEANHEAYAELYRVVGSRLIHDVLREIIGARREGEY